MNRSDRVDALKVIGVCLALCALFMATILVHTFSALLSLVPGVILCHVCLFQVIRRMRRRAARAARGEFGS